MKTGFLKEFEKELYQYVKGLFSYSSDRADPKTRDIFMDTLKGWIQQEAREASIEVSDENVAELVNNMVWDKSYEVRGPLVASLLRALGYMGGSPLSAEEEFLSSKFNLGPSHAKGKERVV